MERATPTSPVIPIPPIFTTTAGAFATTYFGGFQDNFVTKLNPNGSDLVYSTYLGGSGEEVSHDIAVDDTGSAYVTGFTTSTDYPTTPSAFDPSYNGGYQDAFVTKLNPSGSELVYSTFLGGTTREGGYGIALDEATNAYLTGFTGSSDFPTSPGSSDPTYNGGYEDVFVARLNAAGSDLAYSTFLGGSSTDTGFAIGLDGAGNAYVTGNTTSSNFPTTPGSVDTSYNGSTDASITRMALVALTERLFLTWVLR